MSRDSSLWVPVHVGLWTHPRFLRLARLAGGHDVALRALVKLWHATIQHYESGRLEGLELEDVADICEIGDATALVAAGWLEDDGGTLVVHDWESYGGRMMAERAANKERQARFRGRRNERNGDVTVTSRSRHREVTRKSKKETKSPSETSGSAAAPCGAPPVAETAPSAGYAPMPGVLARYREAVAARKEGKA